MSDQLSRWQTIYLSLCGLAFIFIILAALGF